MKLGNLEVTTKHVRYHQGHEGIGLNCNIYVDGVKTAAFYDAADGGEGTIREIFNQEKFSLLKEEIGRQPDVEYKEEPGLFEAFSVKYDIEYMVNACAEEVERKRMENLFKTALVWGVPGGTSYQFLKFKNPLASVPKDQIKLIISTRIKLKPGEEILNTNL